MRVSDLTASWARDRLSRDFGHPQERINAALLYAAWEAQTRTVTCRECHGDGGWHADDAIYGFRQCTECGGRGEIEVVIEESQS